MLPVAVAVIDTLSPMQMVVSFGKVILGVSTMSVTSSVSEPQESETITENVVVVNMVAVGVGLLGLLSTLAGVQE